MDRDAVVAVSEVARIPPECRRGCVVLSYRPGPTRRPNPVAILRRSLTRHRRCESDRCAWKLGRAKVGAHRRGHAERKSK